MLFSRMNPWPSPVHGERTPAQTRIYRIEAPPLSAFVGIRSPFLVVTDERGCGFGLVDLKLVDGEVAIQSLTYIAPTDSDVTDQPCEPPRFRGYRIQRPSVLFRDRHGEVEARIDVVRRQSETVSGPTDRVHPIYYPLLRRHAEEPRAARSRRVRGAPLD